MTVSLRSNQALQASTLIGRSVFVPSSHMVFNNNSTVSVLLFIKKKCINAAIYLENEAGEVILHKPIGDLEAGDVQLQFDPLDGDEVNLGHGQYLLRAEAEIDDSTQMIPTFIKAIVESVKLSGDDHEPVLNLKNSQPIALSKVRIIL